MPYYLVITMLSEHLANMPDLGAWGLWGLFLGTFLASTVIPFSADVLYITTLLTTSNPWVCLDVAVAGNWLALVSWLPLVGDVFSIALGFYKTNPWLTALLFLIGRTLRFLVWTFLFYHQLH